MFCNNCGTELEDGMMFCSNCGAEVASGSAGPDDDDKTVILSEGINGTENAAETTMVVSTEAEQKRFCPNCGTENGINDLFCQECGMFFGNAEEKMAGGSAVAKTGKSGKIWKIAAIVAALLVVVGISIIFVPRLIGSGRTAKKEDLDFVMYLKDNELTMARKNKYEPVVVGDQWFEDASDFMSEGDNDYAYDLITYSPDYKYIYYPQEADEGGCDLYRRKLGDKKKEAEKIDSQIMEYEVMDNDRLAYIKHDRLYLYQKGKSEKIASDVRWMKVSADSKYIMWNSEGKLYVQNTNLKSDKVKLESDISTIHGVSDDFNTIVYKRNDNLYVMKKMEEKEKIASDVVYVYTYDMNGKLKIYYLKEKGEDSVSYYDLIEDDFWDQDQRMAEPRIEDYQRVEYKNTFWGMQESVEVDDSYYEEVDKYQQKVSRDNVRNMLQNNSINIQEWDVYYYDAAENESEKVMVASLPARTYSYCSVGTDTALMYWSNVNLEAIEGPKLSKLLNVDYYEIQTLIEEKLEESRQLLFLENGEVHKIEDFENKKMYFMWANEKKHMMYITAHDGEREELYCLDYGKKGDSVELITDELGSFVSANMDEIAYINRDGELYYGDTKIDDDVGATMVREDEMIFYWTDVDQKKENETFDYIRAEGTLHMYKGGKSVKIADDVAEDSCVIFDGDKVAFLVDYNSKKFRGDLYVFDGKKVRRIDVDVAAIFDGDQNGDQWH